MFGLSQQYAICRHPNPSPTINSGIQPNQFPEYYNIDLIADCDTFEE